MNQHVPEFAMSFTHEAVLLERRDGPDWRPVGQARFSGRDMAATLNALRVESGGVAGAADTVLVIPDDQILYTTLTVPLGSDTAAVLGRALEALTPYRSEDLAFDWCPSDNGDIETLRVAAVARRTLDEAEEFARAQGFRPLGFVARPGDARFEGHPDFGASRLVVADAVRMPFSEPDLTQARITAPVIEGGLSDPAGPDIVTPVVSRITPHHVTAPRPARSPAPARRDGEAIPSDIATEEGPAVVAPAVIRHGDRQAVAAPRLSPRAAAVHSRAAEARARRAQPDEADAGRAAALIGRLTAYRPGRLQVMMGSLLAAVLAVLVMFGGSKDGAELAGLDQSSATASAPAADSAQAATSPAATSPEAAEPEAAEPEAAATADPVRDNVDADQTADAAAAARTDEQAAVAGQAGDVPAVVAAPPATQPVEPAEPAQDDALTRALAEALTPADRNQNANRIAQSATAPATQPAESPISEAASPGDTRPRVATTSGPSEDAAARAATAASAPQLRSSARPQGAPPVRASTPAPPDVSPAVPANPLPFPQRTEAQPPRVTDIRPPARPVAPRSQPAPQTTATQPAALSSEPTAAPQASSPRPLGSSGRPPARPENLSYLEEGSRDETGAPTRLSVFEEAFLLDLLRDLRTAEAGRTGLGADERGLLIRLADARPQRKPVEVTGPSESAVRAAVAAAVAETDRPTPRSAADIAAAAPAATASGTRLNRSSRPVLRPGSAGGAKGRDPGPGNASLSGKAVEEAIAAAVANSSAMPGAVALTALSASSFPPRRSQRAAPEASSLAPAAPGAAPSARDLRAAAEAQNREAAMAEQRRTDAELQAQAEARARAHAARDAQAEANARAQAEARARAQAEAEARAAAARNQSYTPPEAEKEPEVAAAVPVGRGQGAAAATATVKDGITLNRTQIIGTIGAGKASRALVRLSNGRVVTLRLGDRINGGTITEIGNSRITYVKGGRPQELSVLSGK